MFLRGAETAIRSCDMKIKIWGGQGQCLENLSPGNRYAVLGEPLMMGTGPGFMSPGDSEFLLQEKPFELFQLYQ